MSKTLLVFHSYTGNTKVIAEKIKELIDCDMIELEPIVPFSKDYYFLFVIQFTVSKLITKF